MQRHWVAVMMDGAVLPKIDDSHFLCAVPELELYGAGILEVLRGY